MANIIHRKTRRLPSVRKHGFSAFLLLAIITLSIFSYANFTDSPLNPDARKGQEVALDIPRKIPINAQNALPDLLEDDNIPLNVNPTDPVQMLGGPDSQEATNPENTRSTNTGSENIGPRPPESNAASTGPKIILIDGQPVGQAGAQTNTSPPLIRAPIKGLTRISPFGIMPTIASDGRTVLHSYAKPFTPKPGMKYTSVVVGGLGVNEALTLRAINELPGEVSLSFAAMTPNLQNWIDRARARGHEVLIELPMESDGFDSAAPDTNFTLTAKGLESDNIRNLDNLLSRAQGYFAVTNYGGEILVKNEKTLKPILEHIKNSGLGFVYDGAESHARIHALGRKYALPIITATGFLDDTNRDRRSVHTALSALTKDKSATVPIGMGFSYAGTIDGVLDWVKNRPASIALAPVSYALKTNG